MPKVSSWLFLQIAALLAFASAGFAQPSPARVLIIYNTAWTGDGDGDGVQDSRQVAEYYAEKRGVPQANLLGLAFSSPDAAPADWAQTKTEIVQPILDKLTTLGPKNIDVLLLSYMTPYGYKSESLDNHLLALNAWVLANGSLAGEGWGVSNPYLEATPGIGSDKGRFSHSYALNGDIYLVSRLDGPGGVRRILNLVDEALYADKYMTLNISGYLTGTVYVDSQNRLGDYTDAFLSAHADVNMGSYGSYTATDVNIAYAEHYVLEKGMPLKWHKPESIIGTAGTTYHDGSDAALAPRAILYGGWYVYNAYNAAVWQWLPGSVAVDLDSINFGYGIRQDRWPVFSSSALGDGVSATIGVVNEPYTSGHPRPNVMIYYMLAGYTFAEAAGLSTPHAGFVTVAVGDPLLQPFRVKTPSVDSQAPQFSSGYPKHFWSNAVGNAIDVELQDTLGPEVAELSIDLGPTYGAAISVSRFHRRHRTVLQALEGAHTYHYRVSATDPAGNTTRSVEQTFTTPAQTPYRGTAFALPGVIPLREFDEGGEGIAYHDETPTNYVPQQPRSESGVEITHWEPYSLMDTRVGEWLEYTVAISQGGSYAVTLTGQAWGNPGTIHLELDRKTIATLTLTDTSAMKDVTVRGVALAAGEHVLRVVMDVGYDNVVGLLNELRFTFESADTVRPAPPSGLRATPAK